MKRDINMTKNNKLTPKGVWAQKMFLTGLKFSKRKTKKPVMVAIVGLVGSGKSSVVKELAGKIGATIIEGDAIRICLRKSAERYENASKIGENATMKVIEKGGNVIFDSDFVNPEKRKRLAQVAKKTDAKVIFVRTYADYDIMAGRVISAKYQNKIDDFFGGASSSWKGSEQIKGAAVKLREMWRRTPHHYEWDKKAVSGGGAWVLKKLPFKVFAGIDTSDPKKWKQEVAKLAHKL